MGVLLCFRASLNIPLHVGKHACQRRGLCADLPCLHYHGNASACDTNRSIQSDRRGSSSTPFTVYSHSHSSILAGHRAQRHDRQDHQPHWLGRRASTFAHSLEQLLKLPASQGTQRQRRKRRGRRRRSVTASKPIHLKREVKDSCEPWYTRQVPQA